MIASLLLAALILLDACDYSQLSIDRSGLNLITPVKNRTTKKTIVSLIFTGKPFPQVQVVGANRSASCRWLRSFKKQSRQCQRRRGLAEVLQTAKSLATQHCEEKFKYDRWNCSSRKSMFQNVYRETAFMYAISASAVMFAAAKACHNGKLQNCHCSETPRPPKNGNWMWGGCGDNMKKACRIANTFLNLRNDIDGPTKLLNYNIKVGFRAVRESVEKICVCHGVSGSCALRTCYKRIRPFEIVAENLKKKYSAATMIDLGNQANPTVPPDIPSSGRLLYLAQSPNYCDSTAGRECRDHDNCATLCCGRGYEPRSTLVTRTCGCRWHQDVYRVTCNQCVQERDQLICK